MNVWSVPRLTAAGVVAAAAGCAVAVTVSGPFEAVVRGKAAGWGVYVDIVTVILLFFVGCLSWLVATFARTNLRGQRDISRFALILTGVVVAIAVMVAGSNLIIMAAGWTASGLGLTYLLQHSRSHAALRAARYARGRLLFGDAFLWMGVLIATATLPTIDRAALAAGTAAATGIVVVCLVVGGVVRSSLVPFHRWLPETAEAPSPVSALLHAGLVNGLGIVALLCWPLFRAVPSVLAALLVLGTLSVVVGTLSARLRADVKGQLACSTTAQMGYLAVQIGLGLPAAALLHLVGHGCYKAWLFLRAGGSVTRNRHQPPGAETRRRAQGLRWAAVSVGTAAALGLPAFLQHRTQVTGLVPVGLALAAAGIAGLAAAQDGVATRGRAGLAILGGLAAAGYLWLLLGWELLLARSLPLVAIWSAPAAWAIVTVLVLVGAVLARVALGLRPSSAGPLATLISSSGLPPWSSTIGGHAGWLVDGRQEQPKPSAAPSVVDVVSLVTTAGAVVAPAWPLREMVAANPLAGLQGVSFETATALVERTYGVTGYLPLRRYLELFDAGRITEHDLAAALAERGNPGEGGQCTTTPGDLVARSRRASAAPIKARQGSAGRRWCEQPGRPPRRRGRRGMSLADVVDDHAAWWTQRAWARVADQSPGPWQLWRTAAAHPVYDLVTGVTGASAWVRKLPKDPAAAVATLLNGAGLTVNGSVGYACQTLAVAPGWAAHAQWRGRQQDDPAPLMELFALRVALDMLITGALAPTIAQDLDLGLSGVEGYADEPSSRGSGVEAVWQRALEIAVHRPLVAQLQGRARTPAGEQKLAPAAQLIFCIDVRSERVRRHLEVSGAVQTFGVAGFFGATVRYRDAGGSQSEQYPALVKPSSMITATGPDPTSLRSRIHRVATSVSAAPVAPLLVAEAAGLLAGLATAAASISPRRWQRLGRHWTRPGGAWTPDQLDIDSPSVDHPAGSLPVGLSETQMVDIAAGALQTIGLVDTFAPVVVICGHEASAENNAFASAYDCGACGGNSGRINARILAQILNRPTVRARLLAQGIAIPDETLVIAAVHNTTTDDIDLDPLSTGWTTHHQPLDALRRLIQRATSTTAAERSKALPRRFGTGRADLRARSADWAEPTPEWGLAGNTAMVIGPRHLTEGLDLHGRVFLHSYDVAQDDARYSTLEQLLTAPAVVGQWINAQYYFSTVAPQVFGAGDKTTHNVVGDVGVLTGAHGDLRIGLPWQALFSADPAWVPGSSAHEPVRLLVIVAAKPHAVRTVVLRQPGLQQLVANDWLRIVSLNGEPATAHQLSRTLVTEPWLLEQTTSSNRADQTTTPSASLSQSAISGVRS